MAGKKTRPRSVRVIQRNTPATRWERLRDAILLAREVLEEEEVGTGFDVDSERMVLQDVLGVVVDAAGFRWHEQRPDGRYTAETAADHYALSNGLLRVTTDALRNEAKRPENMIAKETWPVVRALAVAHRAGDAKAITEGTAVQGRDAPAKWANNYLRRMNKGPRRRSVGESRELLVQRFESAYFERHQKGDDLIGFMVTDAVMYGCIEPIDHGIPPGLRERVRVDFATKWPSDAADAVERLLKLAGIRDPLNTLAKREKRRAVRSK